MIGRMELSGAPFLKESRLIRHHSVDAEGRLKVAALCDFFQDAAARHADQIGVGLKFLAGHSLVWVLSRLQVEVLRCPEVDETVEVMTWPSGFQRLFAMREFSVTDARGAVAARATSAWLLLEREGFRPCRASELLGISDDSVISKLPRHFPLPGKLRQPEGREPDARLTSRVLPSEIDLNRHFNNAMYAARMSDVLGGAFPRTFQLNFQRSVAVGETVEYLAWREGNAFTVSGRAGGEECFVASGVL